MFLVDNTRHHIIKVDNFDELKLGYLRENMDNPEELTFTIELKKSSTHSSLILAYSKDYNIIEKGYNKIKQAWINGEKELECSLLGVRCNFGSVRTR